MARREGENFPVASRLLPRRTRGHLLALYGFARLVDDIGDEAEGDRQALLDFLDAELDRTYDGEPTLAVTQRFGCDEDDLRARPPSDRVRSLMAFEVARARALLTQGAPLIRTLRGRPAL